MATLALSLSLSLSGFGFCIKEWRFPASRKASLVLVDSDSRHETLGWFRDATVIDDIGVDSKPAHKQNTLSLSLSFLHAGNGAGRSLLLSFFLSFMRAALLLLQALRHPKVSRGRTPSPLCDVPGRKMRSVHWISDHWNPSINTTHIPIQCAFVFRENGPKERYEPRKG